MTDPSFIQGDYKLGCRLVHFEDDRICATLGIFKGGEHVGYLYYNTAAKQIVFQSCVSVTSKSMGFIKPLMDMSSFIFACKAIKAKQAGFRIRR